jgi:hypothetical protein
MLNLLQETIEFYSHNSHKFSIIIFIINNTISLHPSGRVSQDGGDSRNYNATPWVPWGAIRYIIMS